MDPFQWLDATAQAELVKKREVKPSELVDAAIARIERLNPKVNAVITPTFEEARRNAMEMERSGPFAGVPFLVKDLELTKGVPYTAGSAFLKDWIAPLDSPLMTRLRKAGFITLGKTSTPEFGILPVTEPEFLGPTRNPWNLNFTPGGSSGGAAAAVASGMVPIANASDGGGSIRIPASCSGLFGLKISRGRNPHANVIGLSVSHCLSRSVRDSAAMLDAVGGAAPGDLYQAPDPDRPFLSEVGANTGKLRVALTTTRLDGSACHPDAVAAVQQTAELCRDLGHEVVEAMPAIDIPAFNQAFLALWSMLAAMSINNFARMTGRTPSEDQFEPMTWLLAQEGWRMPGTDYVRAFSYMQELSWAVAQFFTQYDVWLAPVLSGPPKPIGSIALEGNLQENANRLFEWVSFTPLANATGIPAMSVPLYWNDEDLPIGSHFMARYGNEATLLQLAAQLEQARPWAHKYPPVS